MNFPSVVKAKEELNICAKKLFLRNLRVLARQEHKLIINKLHKLHIWKRISFSSETEFKRKRTENLPKIVFNLPMPCEASIMSLRAVHCPSRDSAYVAFSGIFRVLYPRPYRSLHHHCPFPVIAFGDLKETGLNLGKRRK